ncbi:hypothetical protein TRIP_B250364 [uncultured Desulfatiglans sp.]|nr:hypothetical protein TRIP_B250364 [uncultured Desulfatiglans sp.]
MQKNNKSNRLHLTSTDVSHFEIITHYNSNGGNNHLNYTNN